MGFHVSWLAVRGRTLEQILPALGLSRTGRPDPLTESPISAVELAVGWSVVFANDYAFAESAPAGRLSIATDVLCCGVEETVMASYARGFGNGMPAWTVDHDSSRGIFDLRVAGSPPAIERFRDEAIARQRDAGGLDADVDHLFNVPVDVTRALTSFRHDEGEFAFEALRHLR